LVEESRCLKFFNAAVMLNITGCVKMYQFMGELNMNTLTVKSSIFMHLLEFAMNSKLGC